MRTARPYRILRAAVTLAVLAACARMTGCSPALFWERRAHLTDLIVRMLPPDWGYLPSVLKPLLVTFRMSVTGTFLGAFLSLCAAPVCAANLPGNIIAKRLARALIQFLRTFPVLITALAATFLFGLGAFAGTAALTVYTFAILTRLTCEDIEHTPSGAARALAAMGAAPAQVYWRAVVPEIAPSFLTNALYLLEANVRHGAVLGYVGAGGIGLLLNEKIAWLEYDRVAVILAALYAASLCAEQAGACLTGAVRGKYARSPKTRRLLAAGAAALFLVCTFLLEPPDLTHTGLRAARSMAAGLLRPDLSLFFRPDQSGVGYLLLETVCIAVLGTALGAVIALPLAVCSAPRLLPVLPAACFRALAAAVRSVPFLIYGLIFIRVTGPGAFAGVLTLAMCSVGLLCKRFAEAVERADLRAYGALRTMGVPFLPRLRYALFPQVKGAFAAAVLYRFDVNVREASVLGVVGAGGIGAPLIFAMNRYDWPAAGALLLGLLLLVWAADACCLRTSRWRGK